MNFNFIFNPLYRRRRIVRLIRGGNDGLCVAQRRNERDCNDKNIANLLKITRKTKQKIKQNKTEKNGHFGHSRVSHETKQPMNKRAKTKG